MGRVTVLELDELTLPERFSLGEFNTVEVYIALLVEGPMQQGQRQE